MTVSDWELVNAAGETTNHRTAVVWDSDTAPGTVLLCQPHRPLSGWHQAWQLCSCSLCIIVTGTERHFLSPEANRDMKSRAWIAHRAASASPSQKGNPSARPAPVRYQSPTLAPSQACFQEKTVRVWRNASGEPSRSPCDTGAWVEITPRGRSQDLERLKALNPKCFQLSCGQVCALGGIHQGQPREALQNPGKLGAGLEGTPGNPGPLNHPVLWWES